MPARLWNWRFCWPRSSRRSAAVNESAMPDAPSPRSDASLAPPWATPLEPSVGALRPAAADIERRTDRYFVKTKQTIGRFGDKTVCYAIFMRRPVIFTPRLMVRWLEQVVAARQIAVRIALNYREGDWVGAGEPL